MEELTATNDAGIKDRDRAETRRDPIRYSPFAIRPTELSPHAERIVAIARSWIGTPYVHQASLKGVDFGPFQLPKATARELRASVSADLQAAKLYPTYGALRSDYGGPPRVRQLRRRTRAAIQGWQVGTVARAPRREQRAAACPADLD